MGSTNAIGLMMRWYAQLLLAVEDHHFEAIEGSMLLKTKGGIMSRFCQREGVSSLFVTMLPSFVVRSANFKVMVLHCQEELSGPSRH